MRQPDIMMNDDDTPEGDLGIALKTRPKSKRPPMYKVMLLNDDYTPMEFVIHILERFFGLDHAHAFEIMLTVHKKKASQWSASSLMRSPKPRSRRLWTARGATNILCNAPWKRSEGLAPRPT